MSPRPVLIIDALNLFIRHYVANPAMNDSGEHIGGFLGFIKSVSFLCERTNPKEVIIVWEGGGSPRRRAILKNYKDKRRPVKMNRYYDDEIPDTLENRNRQISLAIEAFNHLPCRQIYIPDCEADDIIARIVKYDRSKDRKVIVSSDKDLYQLLSKDTIQWSPGQKKYITAKTVKEKFNISASNFCTAKCFVGDQSDKIKGVKGAGFRSLSKRFPALADSDFVSVSDIVAEASRLKQTSKIKLYENITSEALLVKRNWKLMYLDTTNLSANQIIKIQEKLENQPPPSNKIDLFKIFRRVGISNFNIDAFFVSLNALSKNRV